MPSACAVLTSAPSLRSVRTASRLPLIAASTTASPPAGAAAEIIPASGIAASAPNMQMLISVLRIVIRPRLFVVSAFRRTVVIVGVSVACGPAKAGHYVWTDLSLRVGQYHGRIVQIELAAAVAEAVEIRATEHMQHRQHRVGHRRAVRRLDVHAALQLAAGMAGDQQRDALVIVDVRVAHRRAVND